MRKATTSKSKARRVPTVTQHLERAERQRLRAQVNHNQQMRDLSRRLKATANHTDLQLQSLVRDLAPRVRLTVVDRVEWERQIAHLADVEERNEELARQLRELREVRSAEVER